MSIIVNPGLRNSAYTWAFSIFILPFLSGLKVEILSDFGYGIVKQVPPCHRDKKNTKHHGDGFYYRCEIAVRPIAAIIPYTLLASAAPNPTSSAHFTRDIY